jgi:hypothetical protein
MPDANLWVGGDCSTQDERTGNPSPRRKALVPSGDSLCCGAPLFRSQYPIMQSPSSRSAPHYAKPLVRFGHPSVVRSALSPFVVGLSNHSEVTSFHGPETTAA